MFPHAANLLTVAAAGSGVLSGTTPTFVGSKTQNTSSATSITVSLTNLVDTSGATATLATNDYVIVAVSGGSSGDLTFSEGGGTWSKECDLLGNDTSKANFAVFTKIMGGSPDSSVTISGLGGTNNATTVAVFAFRGVHATTPQDVASVAVTGPNTGLADPGAITPTTIGSLIVVAAGASISAGVGLFTNPGDLDTGTNHFVSNLRNPAGAGCVVGAGFIAWSGSGAFDPMQWTGNTTSTGCAWCALTMALRPADAH